MVGLIDNAMISLTIRSRGNTTLKITLLYAPIMAFTIYILYTVTVAATSVPLNKILVSVSDIPYNSLLSNVSILRDVVPAVVSLRFMNPEIIMERGPIQRVPPHEIGSSIVVIVDDSETNEQRTGDPDIWHESEFTNRT